MTTSLPGRTVLIVDDEPDMLAMLKLLLAKKCDCRVITATSGRHGLARAAEELPAVVVTDIKMPDMDGLSLLKKLRRLDSTISVIMMTGYGTIDMAVQSLKDGAYDFLQKPFDKDVIIHAVNKCIERTGLLRANQDLSRRLADLEPPDGFVGQSPPLKKTLALLRRVADSDATVLIRGESGTGKEVAARALHALSGRSSRAMVTVNCPALPESILESELFGYSRGAFTGALEEKKGLFLEASGSTLLLDELGDMPVAIQTKLLRVLQEKEIQPLGQNRTIPIDVRVVASTNQDLEEKIASGDFREDLFYRLNVVSITMPSLREISEDIPLLINHFLRRYTKKYRRAELTISPRLLNQLWRRPWRGNIRELQNTIKRLVLVSPGPQIDIDDFDEKKRSEQSPKLDGFAGLRPYTYGEAKSRLLQEFSEDYLSHLLKNHSGNVTRAAAAAGMERQALQRLLRRSGLSSSDFRKPD